MKNKFPKNSNKKGINVKLPTVYIILPVYNCEKYFLEQLMSIYYQNYGNRFLIIVNDWSTDSSWKIAEDFVKNYNLGDKVKIVTKENWWVNSAVTVWLEELKKITDVYSDDILVAYCDSDDVWTREKLSVQVDYMVNHPDCDISYHDMVCIDKDWILINSSLHKNWYHDDSFFYLSTISPHIWSTEMMFWPKKYIDSILPLPAWAWMYQDYRTNLVISLLWWKYGFIDKKLGNYRQWHISLSTPSEGFKWRKQSNLIDISLFIRQISDSDWGNPYLINLQERFPDKDLSYEISYCKDMVKQKSLLYRYLMIMFKYPKVFILWLKVILYKVLKSVQFK